MEPVNDALDLIRQAAELPGKWYAAAVAVVVVAIRIYRRPEIQGMFPSAWRWRFLPFPWRVGLVFTAAAGASWAAGIIAGQPPEVALLGAVGIGLGAIGAHKTSKAIGHAQTDRALRRDGALYEPSAARRALEPILPIDRKAIRKAQAFAASKMRAKRGTGEN